MGMFTRLFGGKVGAAERIARAAKAANLRPPNPGEPAVVEIVPNEVSVTFYAHDDAEGLLGNFLTAVTEGLSMVGQRELVLTLRLERNEPAMAKMQELIRFFSTVHAWTQQGAFVDEGGFTQFGERGLFGSNQSGLLYADARALPSVELPPKALAAIFVDAREVHTARDFGTYRVLLRIGAQLRLFPYPTWGALDRPSAMTPRESSSVLAKVSRVPVRGASFVIAEQCLLLSIPRGMTQVLSGMRSLPAGASFALLLRPAPAANAVLVWRPGQQEASRLAPDGSDASRISGTFVMFIPGQQVDQARAVEDGYSVQLSGESWAKLTAALLAEQPLTLGLTDDMRFQLEWSPPPNS